MKVVGIRVGQFDPSPGGVWAAHDVGEPGDCELPLESVALAGLRMRGRDKLPPIFRVAVAGKICRIGQCDVGRDSVQPSREGITGFFHVEFERSAHGGKLVKR